MNQNEYIVKNRLYNPKAKELFENTLAKEFKSLQRQKNTIFEDINYTPKFSKIFEEFALQHYNDYAKLKEYDKKVVAKNYLYESLILPMVNDYHSKVENHKIKRLEEGESYFLGYAHEAKMENTLRFIFENYIFDAFPKEYKDKIINTILEEKARLFTELEDKLLEESLGNGPAPFVDPNNHPALAGTRNAASTVVNTTYNIFKWLADNIIGIAQTWKEILILTILFIYSPWLIIGGESTKFTFTGMSGKGKLKQLFELIYPGRIIGDFLFNNGRNEIGEVLKKINEIDDPRIRKLLVEVSGDNDIASKVISDCWVKNVGNVFEDTTDVKDSAWTLKRVASSLKSIRQFASNPQDLSSGALKWLFSIDAGDPVFQKAFFNFRKCAYDHVFDVLLGYAKIAMELNMNNKKIIDLIKEASKRNDYAAFRTLVNDPNIDPKEEVMFKVGEALLAIDEIAEALKDHKRELHQDMYVEQFYIYLKQKLKQAFLDLDEMAEKRTGEAKDKEDSENDEEEPYSEDWKEHSLTAIRHGKKPHKIKSIYEM